MKPYSRGLSSVLLPLLVLIFLPSLPVSAADGAAEDLPYATSVGILSFADYLFLEKDYERAAGEFQRYLFLFPGLGTYTVNLKIGMSLERAGRYGNALGYFSSLMNSAAPPDIAHLASYETALTFIRMGDYQACLSLLGSSELPVLSDVYNTEIVTSLGLLLSGRWSDAGLLLAKSPSQPAFELKKIADQAYDLPFRKPVAAALLSFFIPGLGKIYAGRWQDGLFSLVTIGLFAGLSAYNFYNEGTSSVKGWVYCGLGAVFHIANIYGSAVAARQFNQIQEDRIFSEVWDFVDAHY